MHLPHIKKRKASVVSVEERQHDDEGIRETSPGTIDVEKKEKREKKKTRRQRRKDKTAMAEGTQPQAQTLGEVASPQPEPASSTSPSSPTHRVDSVTDSLALAPTHTSSSTLTSTSTTTTSDAATTTTSPQQPRRSSRIKNSMETISRTWSKARPYIERMNGTIMPLEPQGAKGNYGKEEINV